jgi:uncharacterized protein (TIGR02452 family)
MMSDRTSKFLSFVLRHRPEHIGITVDHAGWTDVDALIAAANARGFALTRSELDAVVVASDKQRFALSDDGMRIRANQGHSIALDLDLEPATPPAELFHGTVEKLIASIRERGLSKGVRHHVHLSASFETAKTVGKRRGKPVVLTIDAAGMAAAGHVFFRSANGVWLVEHVPSAFITFPQLRSDHAAGGGNRSHKVKIARTSLEACDAGHYTNAAGVRVELAPSVAAAKAGTVVYELGVADLGAAPSIVRATACSVTSESTIAALVRLSARPGHLACLNFASARNPGGGFLSGAQAQEESLARSSALYPCQVLHPEHYERNRRQRSLLYLDVAMWSPRVPFFRDDHGAWLDAPVLASVITCAAPNAGCLDRGTTQAELDATLRRRAAFVLAIARHHGVERLVLGAWGAGVFRNDPMLIAEIWKSLLASEFAGAFAEVVFAVLGTRETSDNHRAFADAFGDGLELRNLRSPTD